MESSRSNTTRMRPGFHVPVSFVSLLVTATIVISRTFSFSLSLYGRAESIFETCYVNVLCYLVYRLVYYSLAMSSLEIIRGLIHNTLYICDSFIHHCFKSFTMQEDLRYTCSYYEMQTFTCKPMIKIEYSRRNISAKEISSIDKACTHESST